MLTHFSKTIPNNQKAEDQRRSRTILSRLSHLYRLDRTTDTKAHKQEQKKVILFSKKKKHAVKNLYAVNQRGLIIHKSKHKQIGKKHDYKIYKTNHPDMPKEIENMFDLGFLGVEKDFPTEQKSSLPVRKKKNCEMTLQEIEYNREHSKRRIIVEHTICRIKITG